MYCEPIGSVAELEARVGRSFVTDEEKAMAAAALEDAAAIARAYGNPYWGCVASANTFSSNSEPTVVNGVRLLAAPLNVPAGVKAVCLAMAARAMRNPDGFVSETAGEYTYRYSENTANGLAPSPGEILMLEKLAQKDKIRTVEYERAVQISRQKDYPYEADGDVIWDQSSG
jgi:fructose-specific component phosphotransferase system IIB-like protein